MNDQIKDFWNTMSKLSESNELDIRYYTIEDNILFINLNHAINKYIEYNNRNGSKVQVHNIALKTHLKVSPSFIKELKGKRMGGQVQRCCVFDMDKMDVKLVYNIVSTNTAKTNKIDSDKLINTNIAKVAELRNVLSYHYIDDDRSIIGSEPFFVPIVTGKNRDIVLEKLIDIIKEF